MRTTTEFKHFRTDCPNKDYVSLELLYGVYEGARTNLHQVGKHRKKGYPAIKAAVRCVITDANGVQGIGLSFCSKSENFVTKTGRRIALGRAKKALREAQQAKEATHAGV